MSSGDTDLSYLAPQLRRRVEMTTSVRATDQLPKVDDAGAVRTLDGREVQVMHNGVLVEKDCYGGPFMTEIISRLRGHHEPQEEIAFAEIIDRLEQDTPEPVMIELGAYWAYYSLWFRSRFSLGSLLLVEPDEVNLQVGLRNFALNNWAAPPAVHAAVGADHSAMIEIRYESDGAVHPVRAVTLDGLAQEQQLPRIDLVLCDVQGAEVEMLAGAERLVREERVRFVIISTHWSPTNPLIHQTCRARVQQLGGHIIAEHSIPESCSGDGLIVCSFDRRDRELVIDMPIVRSIDSEVGELEWMIASRSGLAGIAWGLVDLVPKATRERLGGSRLGTAVHHRLASRRAVV